jgi:hypothetical protein
LASASSPICFEATNTRGDDNRIPASMCLVFAASKAPSKSSALRTSIISASSASARTAISVAANCAALRPLSGCGYVAASRTQVVLKENCQAPPETSEFLSKFALNPVAVVVLKEPTALQYANNSLATTNDQRAIALLAQAREQCFGKLEDLPHVHGAPCASTIKSVLIRLKHDQRVPTDGCRIRSIGSPPKCDRG